MSSPGRVIDVAGLPMPGGQDTLALAGVDRVVFDQLVHDHPPAAGSGLFDVDGLGPVLIAACAADPILSPTQAQALFDDWPEPDAEHVFGVCLELCLPAPSDRAWWRLEREPRLAAEMDYCGPRGIPHAHFLGGPAGWTDIDRDLALAWQARQQATCRGCGTRPDQWANDPQAFGWDARDCPGCYQLSRARKAISEQDKDALDYLHPFLAPLVDGDNAGGP